MVTISYCTAADVRRATSFPSTGAPISDDDIEEFIADAEEEIERLYNTKFGAVAVSATADSGANNSLTDTGAFTGKDYSDYVVWIVSGTGSGQYRGIVSNTDDIITVSPNWNTNPDNTSVYKVLKLGFKEETVDGTGIDTMFVNFQPLVSLVSLTVDSTSVSVANVFKYNDSGRIVLSNDAEVNIFKNNKLQLVDLVYSYGIYPFPRVIKRLCTIIAAIKTLVAQIAGTYDDFTTVSLPGGFQGSKGEPYTNIREAVSRLQNEARSIVFGDVSKGISPVFRPYALFG